VAELVLQTLTQIWVLAPDDTDNGGASLGPWQRQLEQHVGHAGSHVAALVAALPPPDALVVRAGWLSRRVGAFIEFGAWRQRYHRLLADGRLETFELQRGVLAQTNTIAMGEVKEVRWHTTRPSSASRLLKGVFRGRVATEQTALELVGGSKVRLLDALEATNAEKWMEALASQSHGSADSARCVDRTSSRILRAEL